MSRATTPSQDAPAGAKTLAQSIGHKEECCTAPRQKDLTQGLGEHRHIYCSCCKAHWWNGEFFTREKWDAWIEEAWQADSVKPAAANQ